MQCIGNFRLSSGVTVRCPNLSDNPSNLQHPEWGFLCSKCANSNPNPRQQLQVDFPEADKPNYDDDVEFFPVRVSQESQDTYDFDHIEELDLT
jgi:hypothetical protein